MANEPKINLALVGEMPENPVRGTVYMSPDASGNFVKVGVDGSVRTIFDGSDYVRKDESVWIPGYGEKSAVLANEVSYATGGESVSHGYMTYARGENSHAEGAGLADYPISVYSDFSNNIIYSTNTGSFSFPDSYIGLPVSYHDVYATIVNAYLEKKRGIVFVLDKPLLDDGSDFIESTEVYLLSGGVAEGVNSHTEGDSTVAIGDSAHAEGLATYAGNRNSHAEGIETNTYGEGAHAEGSGTLATGDGSHVEGNNARTLGGYSHAEGVGTTASGDYSHAEGEGQEFSITINGPAGTTHYTVTGGSLRAVKVGDTICYQPIQKIKRVLLPYEKTNPEGDYRYSVITDVHLGKNWYIEVASTLDPSNAITNSTAYILQGVAEGNASHSEGYCTNAVGHYSHVEGNSTTALGDNSHAEGSFTTASGYSSHAEGENTTASGDYSHAEGSSTTASGNYSHTEGLNAKASGDYSHAEGSDTRAYGRCSHAEGEGTTASGYSSHAEGEGTMALDEYSHAEGTGTEAFGSGSHAEGEGNRIPLDGVEVYGPQNTTVYTTSPAHGLSVNDILYIDYETSEFVNKIAKVVSVDTSTQFTVDNTLNPDVSLDASTEGTYVFYRLLGCAYGTHSHVEGVDTIALGGYSHAEGNSTTALGDYSHAEGGYTLTSNVYEHAQGTYNMSHSYNTSFGNSGNTLNSIGVGVSDASRSNAVEVMQNGDVYVKGVGSYDGSNYVNASTLQEVINDGGGSADLMISITYSALKTLRDTSALIPGMQYRVTNYECTTTQADTSVAGNVFDIIVTADSSTELNENARAAHHEGDTYFQTCDLDAWELKYCLDNDADRFAWADATNGKGVIYYMKDEWSNECPYDFKNIMFKRKLTNGALDDQGTDTWCYTFNGYNVNESEYYDISSHMFYISGQTRQDAIDDGDGADECDMCYGNIIGIAKYVDSIGYKGIKTVLNNIVFLGKSYDDGYDSGYSVSHCFSNVFGNDCQGNTFENYCYNNSFGNNCSNNTFGNSCHSNSLGNSLSGNTFGSFCYNNSFGNNCSNNTFGNSCQNNSLGDDCFQNSFGNNLQYNTFGAHCHSNTFGSSFQYNTLGSNCYYNSFDINFQGGTFGNYCSNNTFGYYCKAITVFNNVRFCIITGGTNTSPVQNAQILNGTKGIDISNKLTITFETNKNYTQIAGLNSSGVLKIWTPADLID